MDITQLAMAIAKAEISSTGAVGGSVTRALDGAYFEGDSFQNSAGIATDQVVDETYALKLADIFSTREEAVKNKIKAVLLQDVYVTDPLAKIAGQAAKKEQIKNILEANKNKTKRDVQILVEPKAFRRLEAAKDRQLNQMLASELASSQGTSDDKQNSMNEISGAYLMGAKDIATA